MNIPGNEDLYKKIFLSDLPLRFISNLKDKCNEVISKDVHINFLSNDKNKRKAEIDFITNDTIKRTIETKSKEYSPDFKE